MKMYLKSTYLALVRSRPFVRPWALAIICSGSLTQPVDFSGTWMMDQAKTAALATGTQPSAARSGGASAMAAKLEHRP